MRIIGNRLSCRFLGENLIPRRCARWALGCLARKISLDVSKAAMRWTYLTSRKT